MHVDELVQDPRPKWRITWEWIVLAVSILLIGSGLAAYKLLGAQSATDEARANVQQLSEIRFQNGAGETLTLADFRGRVVLLNLWATWCVPCRKEMPALDKLQAKLGSPDFEVVALSIDSNQQPVREFYRQHEIKSLALYFDSTANITSALGIIGVPTTLLVDRDGREIWRRTGLAEWDAPPSVAEIRKYMKAGAGP